jgi:3-hydroxybutyryl-CoA dehydrogenase
MTGIRTVGVLGAGLMGGGIAQVAATAGYEVVVRDTRADAYDSARRALDQSLARLVKKDRLTPDQRNATHSRLRFTDSVDDIAASDLIIEAITEDLAAKCALWQVLDAAAPPATIFASNTSSLPISAMAAVTARPDRFLGLHFFSPVPMMPLVEVVRTVATSAETLAAADAFARSLGKETVAARDTPGFIVNLLLIPFLNDAVRALERGVATTADIDTGMRLGCGHPMGPLALLDLIGLDTGCRVSEIMFDEFREARYAPPPLLRRLVTLGWLGRKSGRGFYDYSVEPPVPTRLDQ